MTRTALAFVLACSMSLFALVACSGESGLRPSAGGSAGATYAAMVPGPLSEFETSAYEAAGKVALPETEPEAFPQVQNFFELSPQILSGGEPLGQAAFERLAARGVKTILSVDGKVPDAEIAARYGMSYVHVPIQYKGISKDQIARMAKTFREKPGPFFIHCFHGKHRGPAGAGIGRLVLDGADREVVMAEMRQWCGTSENYEGLYRTIAFAEIPSADETAAMDWAFPAAHPLDGIAGGMVEATRVEDNLKLLIRNGWKPDQDHPDIDPLNEAAKMRDLFRAMAALDELAQKPADFRQWMQDSVRQSEALHAAVVALKDGSGSAADASKAYRMLNKTCKACHGPYRN